MRSTKIIAVTLSLAMVSACSEPNGAPGRGIENGGALSKEDVGVGIGAVGGGLIGSAIGGGAGQVAAIIGGALIGGVLGDMVGKSLDNADRAAYDRASQHAMDTGVTQHWSNSDTGHSGKIVPHKRYRNEDGQYCREYTQTIVVDGKSHQGHGTACRQEDGTWQIQE